MGLAATYYTSPLPTQRTGSYQTQGTALMLGIIAAYAAGKEHDRTSWIALVVAVQTLGGRCLHLTQLVAIGEKLGLSGDRAEDCERDCGSICDSWSVTIVGTGSLGC